MTETLVITPSPGWPAPTGPRPTLEDLAAWQDNGGCYATDGICWIEPDGTEQMFC